MDLILDTSALLSGKFNSVPSGFDNVLITDEVKDEVTKGRPARLLDGLISSGLLVVSPVSILEAVEAARRTGDLPRLSSADLSVLALAMELKDVTVATDDFSLQNVLTTKGVAFIGGGELGDRTIHETRSYRSRCRGCGRSFDDISMKECPICGSEVRPVKLKKSLR